MLAAKNVFDSVTSEWEESGDVVGEEEEEGDEGVGSEVVSGHWDWRAQT